MRKILTNSFIEPTIKFSVERRDNRIKLEASQVSEENEN